MGAGINDSVPGALAADPLGKFVYVGNADSSNITGFAVNASSGALTEIAGSPFPAGAPAWIRVTGLKPRAVIALRPSFSISAR
jgi:6-phosphogluconolactonase